MTSNLNLLVLYFVLSMVHGKSFHFNISCLNDSSEFDSTTFDGNITIGMPVPLQGQFSRGFRRTIVERKIQGLDMYRRYINYCVGGLQIGDRLLSIKTKILDDESNSTLTVIRARQLVDNFGAHFLFPSFTPPLEVAPLDWAEQNKIITMMETGVSYSCPGYEYCYSVRSPGTLMMSSIVKVLALRGARNIALVYNEADRKMSEHCEIIPDLIEDLPPNLQGVQLVFFNKTFQDSKSGMEAVVSEVIKKGKDIDILVACTSICQKFVNVTKNLGLDANAMVFPRCIDRLSVLGKDGRYILAPNQWDESIGYKCDLTGFTPATFADAYRWLYGGDGPFITGAGTFAGGLALGQAVINAGTLDSAEVRYALSRLDIDTMYGRIDFDSNNMGTNEMVFQQIDDNLDIQIVLPDSLATHPLVYPMPVWSYRSCIQEYGQGHCQCSEDGCPICSTADYAFQVSDCLPSSEERYLQYDKINGSDCAGGLPTPEDHAITCDYVPFGSRTASIVITLTTICTVNSFGYLCWVIWQKENKAIKNAQPFFCVVFSMFGIVFSLSTLLYVGEPTTAKCLLRLWVFHLSFTGMVGSLFIKVYRVWKKIETKSLAKVRVTVRLMTQALLSMMLVDIVVLVLLTVFTPPVPATKRLHIPQLGTIPWTYCYRNPTYSSVLVAYKVAIVLVGCFFSFQIRNVPSDFSETKFIMLAIYSIAMVLGITMLVSSQGVGAKLSLLLHAIGVTFSTSIALTCVLVPKMFPAKFKLCAVESSTSGVGPKYGLAMGDNQASFRSDIMPSTPDDSDSTPNFPVDVMKENQCLKVQLANLQQVEQENKILREEITRLTLGQEETKESIQLSALKLS